MFRLFGGQLDRRIVGLTNAFDQQLSELFDQRLKKKKKRRNDSSWGKSIEESNLSHRFQRFDLVILDGRPEDFDGRAQITSKGKVNVGSQTEERVKYSFEAWRRGKRW